MQGGRYEISPQNFLASGSWRCRAAGRVAYCLGADLSDAAGAHHRDVRSGGAATRSDALPSIPTMAEFVPGYEATSWLGIGAPKNTPVEIVDKLNKEINAGLADPNMKARLADLGGTVLAGSPADFGKLIAEET